MKKIYTAEFKLKIKYTKRLWYSLWFFKKTVVKEVIVGHYENPLVLAETEDEAAEKIKDRSYYWGGEQLPHDPWGDNPINFIVLEKYIKVIETNRFCFETIRARMRADEFLLYCHQYLIDPIVDGA